MDTSEIKNILFRRVELLDSLFRKNFDKVEESFDEDAIHDLRVCCRRIIAFHNFVSRLEPLTTDTNLVTQLKHLLKSLNKIRDFQVQKYYIVENISRFPVLLDFLIFLKTKEDKQINKLRQNFKGNLYGGLFGLIFFYRLSIKNKLTSTSLSLGTINEISKDVLKQVLDERSKIEPKNYATYHRTRIAVKKFRYTMEIVQPIYGLQQEELKNLQKVQTILGNIQDYSVLLKLLTSFVEKSSAPTEKYDKLLDFINEKLARLEQDFNTNTALDFWIEFFVENH
jgi:CHAD domain-containing protein